MKGTIAARVRLAREKRDLTQVGLGSKIGMSSTYVLMVERGDDTSFASNEKIRQPSLDALSKLARGLSVPFEWLAFGTGEKPDWNEGAASATGTDGADK